MNAVTLAAFEDELAKIAGLFSWISRGDRGLEKAKLRVDYHFSDRAGNDRWVKFLKNVADPKFLDQLTKHPAADDTLRQHAEALHNLSQAKTVGKVYSSRLPGRSYEIRELQGGTYGCTCPDWRFVGSLAPGYECKHIKAFKAGKVKADD